MDNAVLELSQFTAVPAVSGTDEVTRDALQSVDVVAMALGALMQVVGGILVSTIHAAVAVMVHRAVAHVVLVHEIHDVGNCLGIMGGITINLHIEDVASTRELVVGSLDLGLVFGRALVIDRHMVAVGVINLVGHTGNLAKVLAVAARELAGKPLCGRCQDAVVVAVTLAELVGTVAHIGDDLDAQLLRLVALAVVMSREGNQAFGQADKTDGQSPLVDDTLDLVVGAELAGAIPQLGHEQGELFSHSGLLILEARIELASGDFQHVIKFGKESVDALLLVLDVHAFNGQPHNIDRRERQVAAADGGLFAKTVLKHTCAASHCRHFVLVALRVVGRHNSW